MQYLRRVITHFIICIFLRTYIVWTQFQQQIFFLIQFKSAHILLMVVLITTRQNSLLYIFDNAHNVSYTYPKQFTYSIYRYFDLRIRYDDNVYTDAFGYCACESHRRNRKSHDQLLLIQQAPYAHFNPEMCLGHCARTAYDLH